MVHAARSRERCTRPAAPCRHPRSRFPSTGSRWADQRLDRRQRHGRSRRGYRPSPPIRAGNLYSAPPRLPVRSDCYCAAIKLAVPGFMELGGEIRTHPSERPPSGYGTDTAASIAGWRPETLLSESRLRVAPHAGAQVPRTRRGALQQPKRLAVLGQRPPMPDPQMGTAHLSKPSPAEMAADPVIAIVEDLAERRVEHRPVLQDTNRSNLDRHPWRFLQTARKTHAQLISSPDPPHHSVRAAGCLVAAVEHVGDVVDPLAARAGAAGGGPPFDVPEPGGDGVHRHAGLEAMGGPVGAQRVRVQEPLEHAGGRAAAAHEPVHADGGQGEGAARVRDGRASRAGAARRAARPRGRRGSTFSHASSACCTASGTGTSRARPRLWRTNSR
jgi:hypothetical protein